MKKNSQLSRIVLYQNLGFLTIMTICYLNELLQLPSLIFSGHPFAFFYRRSTLEILLVLAVWFLVACIGVALMMGVYRSERDAGGVTPISSGIGLMSIRATSAPGNSRPPSVV